MNRFALILLLLPSIGFAQFGGTGKFFTFGLKVGANFSQLNTLELKMPWLTGPGGIPVLSGGQVVYDFFSGQQQKHNRPCGWRIFSVWQENFHPARIAFFSQRWLVRCNLGGAGESTDRRSVYHARRAGIDWFQAVAAPPERRSYGLADDLE